MKLAVIPARGGSKRIPRKNIRPFAGRPMIAHSIHAALASGVFDRIIVSTDDPEITAVAREHGAEVPFVRPPELANDYVGIMDVMHHAITWAAGAGTPPEYVCCLYATAPFVTPELLRRGLAALVESRRQYALPVTTFDFPIQRALRVVAEGGLDAVYPEHRFTRSQDLEPLYHDVGQFCWGRAEAWLRGEPVYSPASVPVFIPHWLAQDIDTPEDWQRAEWLYLSWQSGPAPERE